MLKDRTILQDKWLKMTIFGASKQGPDLEMTHIEFTCQTTEVFTIYLKGVADVSFFEQV